MHTKSSPSQSNGILIIVREILENIAPNAEMSDVILLESISAAASQIAESVRIEHDRMMAKVDEFEAELAAQLMAESDALDHQIGF